MKTLPSDGLSAAAEKIGFLKVLGEVKRELKVVHDREVKKMEDDVDNAGYKTEDTLGGEGHHHIKHAAKIVGDEAEDREKVVVDKIAPPEVLQPASSASSSSSSSSPSGSPSSPRALFTPTQLNALDSLTTDARRDLLEVIRKVEAETESKSRALSGDKARQKRIQLREGALIHEASSRLKKDVLDSLHSVKLAEGFLRGEGPKARTAYLRSVIMETEKNLQADKEIFVSRAHSLGPDGKLTPTPEREDGGSDGDLAKAKAPKASSLFKDENPHRVVAPPEVLQKDDEEKGEKEDSKKKDKKKSKDGDDDDDDDDDDGDDEVAEELKVAMGRMKEFAKERTDELATDVTDYVEKHLRAISAADRRRLTHRIVQGAVNRFSSDIRAARGTMLAAADKLKGASDQFKQVFAKELLKKAHNRLKEDYNKARREGIKSIQTMLKRAAT